MQIGDVVKHKTSKQYGTVHYSTFGFSIHFWNEEHQTLGKTLGEKPSVLEQHWGVVELPIGYEVLDFGGIRKIRENDELGRIIIDNPNDIPKNMTEDEEHKFWKNHAMSEKLLEESIINEEDDDLPPPRRTKK